jgi:hypothetical protein
MAESQSVRRAEALDRALAPGVLAGMAAAVAMGLFAMIAAAGWRHQSFSTPLREMAVFADPNLAGGQPPDPSPEPLIFAGAFHLMLGGLFGAAFGLLARAVRLRGGAAVAAGIVYGLAVMVLMSTLVLPAVARLSGAGEPISDLAGRQGWVTFAAGHAVFGLCLGLWVLLRPADVEPGRGGLR